MNRRELADDLERAAAYMDRHGQTRGQFVSITGRVCAVGALKKTTSSGRVRRAWAYLDDVAAREHAPIFGDVPVGITSVNDARMANIQKLFRREARRLRGREGGCLQAEPAATTKTRKGRQQPCLASERPGSGTSAGSALPAALAVLVVAAVAGVALAAIWSIVVAIFWWSIWAAVAYVAIWCLRRAIEVPNWWYVRVWLRKRKAAAQAVEQRQAAWLEQVPDAEPIALGPVAPISTDDVLKRDWTEPRKETHEAPRGVVDSHAEDHRLVGATARRAARPEPHPPVRHAGEGPARRGVRAEP